MTTSQTLCHCSVCNKLFWEEKDQKAITCSLCGSEYAHYADESCKAMNFHERKYNGPIKNNSDSVPDATGHSYDDPHTNLFGLPL